ncbi:MAG: hypothetical protein QJR12_16980 [Mycobacterium sp.]|uniref:hypothetical protein n=1 Tax=Mycobacterium sp. TaxID=1785 RepID=UPI0026115EB6|nr:hypothetical protein [Mycobacterium sp.]MDI3315902.1 hypothetical protein [Mycobacterium sp.]
MSYDHVRWLQRELRWTIDRLETDLQHLDDILAEIAKTERDADPARRRLHLIRGGAILSEGVAETLRWVRKHPMATAVIALASAAAVLGTTTAVTSPLDAPAPIVALPAPTLAPPTTMPAVTTPPPTSAQPGAHEPTTTAQPDRARVVMALQPMPARRRDNDDRRAHHSSAAKSPVAPSITSQAAPPETSPAAPPPSRPGADTPPDGGHGQGHEPDECGGLHLVLSPLVDLCLLD